MSLYSEIKDESEVKKYVEPLSPLILGEEDIRRRNWALALRLMLRELKAIGTNAVNLIFERYKVIEIGGIVDNDPRTGLEFPEDVSRIQWFINTNGEPYVKYIEGKK